MTHQVPWTKTLLEDFIIEGLLTEDEENIMRTRIAGWSIVKQSMEFGMSTATISRIIKKAKKKYDHLHKQFPERFPERKQSKFEQTLDDINSKDEDIQNLLKDFIPTCNKDITKLTASEIKECQKNCLVDNFYEPKK